MASKKPRKPARAQLIRFLNSNANWRDIQSRSVNAQPAEDLSTPTLRRYVSRLRKAEAEGDWLPDRAALRGHRISENKPRNAARKPGQEDWLDLRALQKQKGTYLLAGPRNSIVVERITGAQSAVVNFLARMARVTARRGYRQVAINIYGPKKGQYAQLLWKGGYDPAKLLEAMGFRKTRGKKGRWVLKKGAPGVQKWLLDYLYSAARYPSRWKRIVLYEVYAWNKPLPGQVNQLPMRAVQPLRLNTR